MRTSDNPHKRSDNPYPSDIINIMSATIFAEYLLVQYPYPYPYPADSLHTISSKTNADVNLSGNYSYHLHPYREVDRAIGSGLGSVLDHGRNVLYTEITECGILRASRERMPGIMRKITWELGIHVARFLNFFKIYILKFQKNLTKILDVYNDTFYSSVNFQPEILSISTYTKMTKSDESENFRIGYCSSSQI